MAELYTGIQGSGKSYLTTFKIVNESDSYERIFTNIDGIKTGGKILFIDFHVFMNEIIKKCYDLTVTDIDADYEFTTTTPEDLFEKLTTATSSFEDAIQFLKDRFILGEGRTLIVIDEAQNFFGKTQKLSSYLLWFVTQHRHLYIDLFLITQDPSLLRTDYKLFNVVYSAFPPSKQIIPGRFLYSQYAGLPLVDGNFIKKISVKKSDKVFSQYVSGDKVDSPNIFRRFAFILALALAVVVWGIWDSYSSYHTTLDDIRADSNKTKVSTAKTKVSTAKTIVKYDDPDSFFIAKINLFKRLGYFYFTSNPDIHYSMNMYSLLFNKNFTKEVIYRERFDTYRTYFIIRVSVNFFDIIPKDIIFRPKKTKPRSLSDKVRDDGSVFDLGGL